MLLLPGDVVAVHGDSVIDVGIEVVTDSPFCHTAMVESPSLQRGVEAQGFRTVGYVDLARYRGKSVILRDTELSDAQRQQLVDFVKSKFGARYDYTSIAKEFARYEFHDAVDANEHGRYNCSTIIAAAYLSIGVALVDVAKIPLASPDDLYRSPRFILAGRF
jgi:uncharacterized protein YycO